jgi:shikimate kinase
MDGRGRAIVLIGFMGSGKSSVGRILERKTGWPRFDTDEMISARFGRPIAEIFADAGEEAFRNAEAEVLRQLSAIDPAVIVTGGGIVLRPGNVELLRRAGTLVHLEADEETLFRRVSRRATRPLLQTENPRATLSELLRVRLPLYRQAADFHVDTSRLTHEEVAEAVLKNMEGL